MLYIAKSTFDALKERYYPDYIGKAVVTETFNGKTCRAFEDHVAFKSVLTGDCDGKTCIMFEHIHFEIIPD